MAPTFFFFLSFSISWIFQDVGGKKSEINGVSFHCDKEYGDPFFYFWFKYINSCTYNPQYVYKLVVCNDSTQLENLRNVKTKAPGHRNLSAVGKVI